MYGFVNLQINLLGDESIAYEELPLGTIRPSYRCRVVETIVIQIIFCADVSFAIQKFVLCQIRSDVVLMSVDVRWYGVDRECRAELVYQPKNIEMFHAQVWLLCPFEHTL